jgi:tetratricopeptide (TPR) repeat protein
MTMTAKLAFLSMISTLALTANAVAQMSVTTFGATDAAACYENANSEFSGDTKPCDKAIKDMGLTRGDQMKTYVNRGIIHNRNLDLDAAIDDFNAALEIDDALAEAYLNRGNSFFLGGRFDDAFAEYETALANDISKPWAAWYNIGLTHDAKKQPAKAREAYAKALALKPDFIPAQQKLERSE